MSENQNPFSSGVNELLSQFQIYSKARSQFLELLNLSKSCRDPLAEFSEILVGKILNAALADSRVQKGYDLIRPNQRLVQVKYLLNPSRVWINEHAIKFPPMVDEYALVIFIALQLEAVLVFQRETLSQVCSLLAKAHPNQDTTLQFTKRNYETILSEKSKFKQLGLEVYRFEGV
jgi:hypothetical protein